MEGLKIIGCFSASGVAAAVAAFEISPAAAGWLMWVICIAAFLRGANA